MQVVINHNTPGLPKTYIHRVGRTARAGKAFFGLCCLQADRIWSWPRVTFSLIDSTGRNGMAITLVTQYDIHLVNAIEEQIREFGLLPQLQ